MIKRARILTAEDTRNEDKGIQDSSMPIDPLIHPDRGKNNTKRKMKVKTMGRLTTQSLLLSFSKVALSANIVHSIKKQRLEHSALIGVPLIPFFPP